MNNCRKNLLAISLTALLAGCATHSDTLGLAENEQIKTYSEAFEPARQMLVNNQFDELRNGLLKNMTGDDKQPLSNEDNAEKLYETASELSLIERGLLSLNTGDFERALYYFDIAERKMNDAEDNQSLTASAAGLGKTGFAAILGSEEMANYKMRGYEKVMLLNYKALCYMLTGDRRAYNVTRRAIDRQQEEWEKFREELAKVKENIQSNGELSSITSKIKDERTEEVKQKAALVASAYVNPFGDYVNGVMQEFDSLVDRSLRDNARISYEKAYENNENCLAAKNGAKLVMKNPPRNSKLVQVILSDGFSPKRTEKNLQFQIDKYTANINLPVTETIASEYASSKVTANGKNLKLSSLTEMEAMILRDDQDRGPMQLMMIGLALLRSSAASSVLGKFGSSLAASVQHPDTRSWLALPNRIDVARLYVPNSTKEIKLSTYDANGKVLATTPVEIAQKGPTVVYAVSYGKNLHAYGNSFSWVK